MAEVTIALDAMGGDYGPSVVIPAAFDMLRRHSHLKLILVGKQELIEQQCQHIQKKPPLGDSKSPPPRGEDGRGVEWGYYHPRLSIQDAQQVVGMDEPPASALRSKRDSSMRVAINLVKDGEAQAAVSAGNTGALMAMARFVLKMLPGVDRPAIVYSLPNQIGHTFVLDLGANVDCAAEHLFQFAVMGSVLATAVDNNPAPKVGLLNVGSEAIKGSEQVKKAAQLLSTARDTTHSINYIGFVEGDDIYKGTADVVVCDGFVGNCALKASEGVAKMVIHFAKQEFKRNIFTRIAALITAPVLQNLNKRLDPNRHNGASLLGIRGIVIKSHGRADHRAFANAIEVAMLEVENNIPERIRESVAAQLGNVEKP